MLILIPFFAPLHIFNYMLGWAAEGFLWEFTFNYPTSIAYLNTLANV